MTSTSPMHYIVVGPGETGADASSAQDAGKIRPARRSASQRLSDAAFIDAANRTPGVLLVLAAANALFAIWLGGLQEQRTVLVCAVVALLWLLACQRVQHTLHASSRWRSEERDRIRTRWRRMMALALMTPALTFAFSLWATARAEPEAVVILVLVSLYASAVWAALESLARFGAVAAAVGAAACAGRGEFRLGVSLLASAGLALWLQRQVAVVWRHATQARLDADDLSAALARERDAAVRAKQDADRFVATASHDLRQPMHALGLFVSTLEIRLRGQPEEFLVRNMVQSIEALDQSFGAMLDMSRLDAGSMDINVQVFTLRDVFRRLHLHFAGVADSADLSLRFSPGGKSVRSDPQLLERILSNLIQNALRHTRQGGVVVVARTTATHLNIEVWDTGCGIGAAELPHIFDEFYQVRKGDSPRQRGLGLGLAIVKRLVRLMGHTLTVASRPGRGTMFRLGVPTGVFDEVEIVTAAADTVPLPVYDARVILVIDDEESIREGLCLVLTEWGYEPHAAGTIDEAVARVQALSEGSGEGIDLILSDLHLADGENGLTAIDHVRRVCGVSTPAVVITGDTSADEMHRVMAAGVPLLFKPVQPRKLMSVLRRLTL